MKYAFVQNINKTGEEGIVDMTSQSIICFCNEKNSKLLLNALIGDVLSIRKAHMRTRANDIFELTKGFTTETTDNAMRAALEMAAYVQELTNENEKLYNVEFKDDISLQVKLKNENVKSNAGEELILKELEDKLSTSNSYSIPYKKDSIMAYGEICDHDSGFLCEHRREWLWNFLKNHFKKQ